jgi:hypothetical protein
MRSQFRLNQAMRMRGLEPPRGSDKEPHTPPKHANILQTGGFRCGHARRRQRLEPGFVDRAWTSTTLPLSFSGERPPHLVDSRTVEGGTRKSDWSKISMDDLITIHQAFDRAFVEDDGSAHIHLNANHWR